MMQHLLAEAVSVLPRMKWMTLSIPDDMPDKTAKSYMGTADAWVITVISYDIENQGFPPGSRGYDGVGRRGGFVLHLTRELAEQAFKLAERQQ